MKSYLIVSNKMYIHHPEKSKQHIILNKFNDPTIEFSAQDQIANLKRKAAAESLLVGIFLAGKGPGRYDFIDCNKHRSW